mmetsp:Transcript_17037/g.42663  ORF Transcript_17037/g.42663 Transcript_17037/m.42663 type:complete len:90 (-) Transcript_17037:125-394(-)
MPAQPFLLSANSSHPPCIPSLSSVTPVPGQALSKQQLLNQCPIPPPCNMTQPSQSPLLQLQRQVCCLGQCIQFLVANPFWSEVKLDAGS